MGLTLLLAAGFFHEKRSKSSAGWSSMGDLEKVEEWARWYKASLLKMNALTAVLNNDGEQMLEKVLKKLGLVSASDAVKAAKDDHKK
jgi:hypothetical protein